MIRFIQGTDLWHVSDLAKSMFKDKAAQFTECRKWEADVDHCGATRGKCVHLNPVYIIVFEEQHRHMASMCLLPTAGRTMINKHLNREVIFGPVLSSKSWECKWICLSQAEDPQILLKLFASAAYLMREFQVASLVSTFDLRSLNSFWSNLSLSFMGLPNQLGKDLPTDCWQFSPSQISSLEKQAGIEPLECELALANLGAELSYPPKFGH